MKNCIKNCFMTTLMLVITFTGYSAKPIDCVEDSYTQAIGVHEATGMNDGIEVEKYLNSTGLGKGHAWCAAFVNYNLSECGFETPSSAAWSPSWFTDNVIYHRGKITYKDKAYSKPKSGDVFGIYFHTKNRVAHVGFVDDWQTSKNYLITVEGNTNKAGSREGDGVYRKYRLKSQIYQISRWTESLYTSPPC